MAAADLSGVDRKIEWAKRHLADLKKSIDDTLKAHPCRFVGQMNPKTGEYVLGVQGLPAMDPAWSLSVGDIVHNLRSALDHLAWQLVILDGGTPDENTQFPIRDSPFNKRGQWVRPQLRPEVKSPHILDALEEVQPYFGPYGEPAVYAESQLWRVHRLDIIDKHRLLLVVRAALNVGHMWWGSWGDDPPPSVWLNTSPLQDGDDVARFDFRGHEPPPEFDPHPGISITLNEAAVLDLAYMPVTGVLESFAWWIEWYVVGMRFRHLFP
jgi:hypothetical protein